MKDLSSLHRAAQQLVSTLTEGGDPANPIQRRALFMKLLEQHIAILGKTGSGKSYAAKGFAELLLAKHRRLCVIDPTGVWWGLRADSTGKKPGFPIYLFGREHRLPHPIARPPACGCSMLPTTWLVSAVELAYELSSFPNARRKSTKIRLLSPKR